jgi:glycosyltransferase involved in cell wall biosynthesis
VRLSVITPSLNQARYLGECLDSVRSAAKTAGSSHSVEHLVIDGGSTDFTTGLLGARPEVRWISEPDHGQSHAINKGLAMATGDILAYLCADDLYEPDAIAKVLAAFQEKPEAEVVHADFYFLEGASGRRRLKRSGPFSPARLDHGNFLGQPAVWWRRHVFEKWGGFDESLHFCMDHEYWLRIAPHTRWHYLPEPLASSRLHGDAKTSRQLAAAWREAAEMLTRKEWRLKPWWDYWNMLVWGRHYYQLKRRWFSRRFP